MLSSLIGKWVVPVALSMTLAAGAGALVKSLLDKHEENAGLRERLNLALATQRGVDLTGVAVTENTQRRDTLEHENTELLKRIHELQGACLDTPINFDASVWGVQDTRTHNSGASPSNTVVPFRPDYTTEDSVNDLPRSDN